MEICPIVTSEVIGGVGLYSTKAWVMKNLEICHRLASVVHGEQDAFAIVRLPLRLD